MTFTLATSIWTYWKTVGKDPYREASGIHKKNGYDQDAYRKLTVHHERMIRREGIKSWGLG